MNDTQSLIGKLLLSDEGRDAIHVAVAAVRARVSMQPGTHVRIERGIAVEGGQTVGIIDPFLTEAVPTGARCWCFLYPNTITGLRHNWSHPAFQTEDAEKWLRNFASEWNFDYDEMIESASREGNANDEKYWDRNYVVARGIDLHSRGELGDDEPLFWKNLEAITGKTFGEKHREDFGWSCSC